MSILSSLLPPALLRRLSLAFAMIAAAFAALTVAWRQGRSAGEADFAIRQADARIAALRAARKAQMQAGTLSESSVRDRLARWRRRDSDS
jgi:hypothetical protein